MLVRFFFGGEAARYVLGDRGDLRSSGSRGPHQLQPRAGGERGQLGEMVGVCLELETLEMAAGQKYVPKMEPW